MPTYITASLSRYRNISRREESSLRSIKRNSPLQYTVCLLIRQVRELFFLCEGDGDFETPAADNLVYQIFPAIVFGFPLILLAILAPTKPILTLIILTVFFVIMNVILFRKQLFRGSE